SPSTSTSSQARPSVMKRSISAGVGSAMEPVKKNASREGYALVAVGGTARARAALDPDRRPRRATSANGDALFQTAACRRSTLRRFLEGSEGRRTLSPHGVAAVHRRYERGAPPGPRPSLVSAVNCGYAVGA